MEARSSVRSIIAGLATAGSLGLTATSASAQAIYVDPYVEPYPVIAAPGAYVALAPVIAPPIVRERTIVVRRPAYVAPPAYVYGAPIAPYDYLGYDYAADVLTPW
jgi:hypothetical protein